MNFSLLSFQIAICDDNVTSNMNSEELLQRAAEERYAIVERYKKGRHEGAEIDAWEEPSYAIYNKLDRFGFIIQ